MQSTDGQWDYRKDRNFKMHLFYYCTIIKLDDSFEITDICYTPSCCCASALIPHMHNMCELTLSHQFGSHFFIDWD